MATHTVDLWGTDPVKMTLAEVNKSLKSKDTKLVLSFRLEYIDV